MIYILEMHTMLYEIGVVLLEEMAVLPTHHCLFLESTCPPYLLQSNCRKATQRGIPSVYVSFVLYKGAVTGI